MKKETITLTTIIASEGKTFKRIADDMLIGSKLILGVNDSELNYIEVDKPEEQMTSEQRRR